MNKRVAHRFRMNPAIFPVDRGPKAEYGVRASETHVFEREWCRRRGGIGRRARLKIWYSYECVGSTPSVGTNFLFPRSTEHTSCDGQFNLV